MFWYDHIVDCDSRVMILFMEFVKLLMEKRILNA
jgi:hypothetical protein